jgi:protein-tyrosine phosphatase
MSERPDDTAGSEPTTYNLLFVCSGNTCRSPLAEAIAGQAVRERGWTHVAVASAGTGAAAGSPASENSVLVGAEHGLELGTHRSRPLDPALVDWADLILAMSPSHLGAVVELGGAEKVAMLTDFIEGPGFGAPIDDPFGGDPDAYRRAYDQIAAAVDGLLAKLEPILAP